jgi:WS/DGAT/MGAT family acyltransferase
MERMTGLDAGFLYMETPTLHMHTLKVAVVDPSGVDGGYSFTRFREELAKRLHLLPPFRRRIVTVPLGLHHPMWIEDPAFDLDRHIRRAKVPAPGGLGEMDAVVARIASRPLDRGRPLWEVWMIEGLRDGQIGFVAKIHHAVADGVAAAAMLANVLTPDLDASHASEPAHEWRGEPVPGRRRLVRDALVQRLRELRGLPRLVRRTRHTAGRLKAHEEQSVVRTPKPIRDVPRTSFNGSLSPGRAFATITLPLEDFKRVKGAFGVTLNDVVLAVVSGSLRRYLAARGEHPDRSLTASIPVSADRPDAVARLMGNRVSNLFTSLCTDVEDPVERLRRIHGVMETAKARQAIIGADLMGEWAEFTPPGPFSALVRSYSRRGLASRHRPPVNLVVSNVAGPPAPLYIAGGRLTALSSVGPILEGIGLNVTAWSYVGQMTFAAISCSTLLPEVHLVTEGLTEALDELLMAADRIPA